MKFTDLTGRRVALWGWGREGQSVSQHLRELGIEHTVAVPDQEEGSDPAVLGGEAGAAALRAAEVVIKSPGVPVTAPLYAQLLESGVAITSLSDLWLNDNAERTVAVTGSKGKSTTSSVLTHLLRAAGVDASLRGNIGTSVLTEPSPPSQIVVMELSSYQAQSLTVSPRIVIVTSLFPEHQTWHGSAEAYFTDKLNAIAHGTQVAALPAQAPFLDRVQAAAPAARIITLGPDTVDVDEDGGLIWADGTRLAAAAVPVLGRHQRVNVALACLVAGELGIAAPVLADAIPSFRPLAHRMEQVPSSDGRLWIDDSLATAPEAVVATLQALPDTGPVAVLIGGSDRGLDVQPLVAYLREHPDVLPLFTGPVGSRIIEQLERGTLFTSFAEALAWARSRVNPARVVLLCPGAPSFDEFRDYEHKSAAFRAAAAAPEE
ncbi:MAG: UDP-N-acetylmuramoyl-L-alanine--D-glutamate ligase [Actinomycetia bacterium]|nr:UDP-N-acetylmuramoyl-L-alanine--D-glutamate ligase [Actinomycetes bacterium]